MSGTLSTDALDIGRQCEHISRQCPEIFILGSTAHHYLAHRSSMPAALRVISITVRSFTPSPVLHSSFLFLYPYHLSRQPSDTDGERYKS